MWVNTACLADTISHTTYFPQSHLTTAGEVTASHTASHTDIRDTDTDTQDINLTNQLLLTHAEPLLSVPMA